MKSAEEYIKSIGATLAMLASRDITLPVAVENVQEDLSKLQCATHNQAVRECADKLGVDGLWRPGAAQKAILTLIKPT